MKREDNVSSGKRKQKIHLKEHLSLELLVLISGVFIFFSRQFLWIWDAAVVVPGGFCWGVSVTS